MNMSGNAPPPPELAHGSLTSLPEERAYHAMTRRRALIGGGSLAAGLLLPLKAGLDWDAHDELVNNLAYPGTESSIVTLDYDDISAGDLPYAQSGALVYAGLGQYPVVARRMATKLAETYQDLRISYNEYAGQGLGADNLTDEYEDLGQTVEELDIFLNSMGSITWANVMGEQSHRRKQQSQTQTAALTSNPGRHSPKHIRTLTLCSSPFDVTDVYQEGAVRAITSLGLRGTMTEKFLAKTVLAIKSEHRYRDFKEMLEVAAGDTFDKLPPKMWASQVCQLGSTSLKDFAKAYEGAITKDTLVIYLRPQRASGDRVVKVDQASARAGRFFTQAFGTRFEIVKMPGAGHADIDKACKCAEFEDLLNSQSGFSI